MKYVCKRSSFIYSQLVLFKDYVLENYIRSVAEVNSSQQRWLVAVLSVSAADMQRGWRMCASEIITVGWKSIDSHVHIHLTLMVLRGGRMLLAQ